MRMMKPLQMQAYENLKQMIRDGIFKNGVIYSETKVAKEMGFSRTPLRDAIQRLNQERYIDIIPSKGFMLHEMTEVDLIETYQIRCALEGFCAVQLAKEYETAEAEETIAKLDYYLGKMTKIKDEAGSITEFAMYDRKFHDAIVHYLENSVISDTYDNFAHQMKQQTVVSLRREGRLQETVDEHTAIFENIRIGAVGRTYKATLAHLEKPKEIIRLGK